MIPREWYDLVEPPPGKVLVERDEPLREKGGIILPENFVNVVRTVNATVLSAHEGAPVGAGDRVILASRAGKMFVLGFHAGEEIELWVVPYMAIIAVTPPDAGIIKDLGEHHLRRYKALRAKMGSVDGKWVDGERAAPR